GDREPKFCFRWFFMPGNDASNAIAEQAVQRVRQIQEGIAWSVGRDDRQRLVSKADRQPNPSMLRIVERHFKLLLHSRSTTTNSGFTGQGSVELRTRGTTYWLIANSRR